MIVLKTNKTAGKKSVYMHMEKLSYSLLVNAAVRWFD